MGRFRLSRAIIRVMSGNFVTCVRDAPVLVSPDMQDWVSQDHLARFVIEALERLDLRAVEDGYARRGERA